MPDPLVAVSRIHAAELVWTFYSSGSGDMYNRLYRDVPTWSDNYRDEITRVEIEEGVTSIGDSAFSDCASIWPTGM